MLITEEFEIVVNSKYTTAEKEVLSRSEMRLQAMALCMRDALKAYRERNYLQAYREMLCVDSWAEKVKDEFKQLSEEEE